MAPSSFARPYSSECSSASSSASVGQNRPGFSRDIERWKNTTTGVDSRPLRELAGAAGYSSPSAQIKFHKTESNRMQKNARLPYQNPKQRDLSPKTSQPRQSSNGTLEACPLKLPPNRNVGVVGNPLTRQLFQAGDGASKDSKTKVVGGGLSNLGNTCYMNATLQTLTHTPAFTERLRKHCEEKKDDNRHEEASCMLCILNSHVDMSFHSSGESFRPTAIHDNLTRIGKEFVPYRQEDAHEFLRLLLDACDIKGSDIIDNVFGGKIRTSVTCCECLSTSGTEDPVQDLSLEIDDSDIDSVGGALRKFTAREILDGDNRYECEKCCGKVKARKQIVLTAVPEIIAIQLKRFKVVTKICKYVSFKSSISLDEVRESKVKRVEASLYGVIVHSGLTKSSGHYYAYVKGSDDKWRKFDDSCVYEVSWDEVANSQAYLLFYKRTKASSPQIPAKRIDATSSQSSVSSQVKRGVVGAYRHILQLKKKKLNQGGEEHRDQNAVHNAGLESGKDLAATERNGHAPCDKTGRASEVEGNGEVSSLGLKLVMAYEG